MSSVTAVASSWWWQTQGACLGEWRPTPLPVPFSSNSYQAQAKTSRLSLPSSLLSYPDFGFFVFISPHVAQVPSYIPAVIG